MCSYFLTAFRSAGITLHKLKRVIYRYEYHLTLARWSYNLETKRHPRKRGMGKMAPAQPLERMKRLKNLPTPHSAAMSSVAIHLPTWYNALGKCHASPNLGASTSSIHEDATYREMAAETKAQTAIVKFWINRPNKSSTSTSTKP